MTTLATRTESAGAPGIILHAPAGYDSLHWLLTLGRETAFPEPPSVRSAATGRVGSGYWLRHRNACHGGETPGRTRGCGFRRGRIT
jgi:hypothetical protein